MHGYVTIVVDTTDRMSTKENLAYSNHPDHGPIWEGFCHVPIVTHDVDL
jgi:hypothetical protein